MSTASSLNSKISQSQCLQQASCSLRFRARLSTLLTGWGLEELTFLCHFPPQWGSKELEEWLKLMERTCKIGLESAFASFKADLDLGENMHWQLQVMPLSSMKMSHWSQQPQASSIHSLWSEWPKLGKRHRERKESSTQLPLQPWEGCWTRDAKLWAFLFSTSSGDRSTPSSWNPKEPNTSSSLREIGSRNTLRPSKLTASMFFSTP